MEIFWTDKLKLVDKEAFNNFIQKMAYRLQQGFCRYGNPKSKKKYMTKIALEFKAYKKTGNAEHLYNIANYCHLECYAPENKKYYFDPRIDSVTRGKV